MRITPPTWLRHITPWWLVYWIDKHYSVCWTALFLWKWSGCDMAWWPTETCFHPYDYCNKFPTREEQLRVLRTQNGRTPNK